MARNLNNSPHQDSVMPPFLGTGGDPGTAPPEPWQQETQLGLGPALSLQVQLSQVTNSHPSQEYHQVHNF